MDASVDSGCRPTVCHSSLETLSESTKRHLGDDDQPGDDEAEPIEEDPRVNEPLYQINRPQPPKTPDDQDEWKEEYLGKHLETYPSLDFDPISVSRGVVHDHGLTNLDGEAYWVDVITSEADCEAVLELDTANADTRAQLEAVDFVESVLVVVESGYGSGSVDHRWARVEDAADGLHLHGYYTDLYDQTDDITTWVSVLEIERPDDEVDFARVSLTVDEDRCVHFNSTEGVVSFDSEKNSHCDSTGDDEEGDEVLDPPRDLVLENHHDDIHTVSVTLSREGEELHNGDHTLEPDMENRIKNLIFEPGNYRLKATLEDGTTETIEQTVSNEVWHAYVTITEDGELFLSYDVE